MASGRTDVLIRAANPAVAVPQPVLVRGSVSVPTPAILIANSARFPGDPGTKVLHGLNDNSDAAFNNVQTAVGRTFKLRRSYNGNNWGMNTGSIDEDHTAGRISVTSWKLSPYTLTTVPDSAIDANIAIVQARPTHTFWICPVFHEPEDNFADTTSAGNFRALFRRTVLRFRAAGVTNVAWVSPFFQSPFTWTNRDFRLWHPDWNGGNTNTSADWFTGSNSVIDIEGYDSYIPLIGSTNWQAEATTFGKIKAAMAAVGYPANKPFLVGELGVKSETAPSPVGQGAAGDPTLGPSRMQDAFDTAKANNFVGICWWNTGGDSFLHGPVPANDPGGFREQKLATIVADPRSG
jgi:hypothetical protein